MFARFFAAALLLPATLNLFQGCSGAGDEPLDKPGRSVRGIGDTAGERVTIETSSRTVEITAGGVGWPAGIPGSVPPCRYGTIRSVARTETPEGVSWSVALDVVSPEELRRYESELEAAGFTCSSMIVASGGSLTARKGGISVAVVSSQGNATVSVAMDR
jgi:hypothetical protein